MRDAIAVVLYVHVQYAHYIVYMHTCTLAFLNIPMTKTPNCIHGMSTCLYRVTQDSIQNKIIPMP